MSSPEIHAPSLEAFENKSHHIRFACQRMFQHVSSTGIMVLCPILTLMQSKYLKTQNMKL